MKGKPKYKLNDSVEFKVGDVNTKRNFIGIELNDEYFAIAEKRVKEAQSQLTLF